MKILFLLHTSGSSEGSSIAALSIMQQLLQKGHQVYAVCPKQGPLVASLKELGMDVSIIRYASAIYPKVVTLQSLLSWPKRMFDLLWYNHLAEGKLKKLVVDIKPDVIHTNVGVLRVGYYVAKKMGIPHVWHVRECYKSYPHISYQKELFTKNTYNIAITESVKEFYGLKDANTKVVYDGVFSESINIKKCAKSKYFLFVGRVIPLKGPDWAIDSFLKIANNFPDYELWLAGSETGSFATELKRKVNSTDYSNRIKFLGQRHDIYELMSNAQAVLVPSSVEGFGFTTVEAMLNHTVVIGRNTSGTKEQFDNGLKLTGHEIGLRCETIHDMAKHMADVIKNGQAYYSEMILRANATVRKFYTTENNANQIGQIYKSITI